MSVYIQSSLNFYFYLFLFFPSMPSLYNYHIFQFLTFPHSFFSFSSLPPSLPLSSSPLLPQSVSNFSIIYLSSTSTSSPSISTSTLTSFSTSLDCHQIKYIYTRTYLPSMWYDNSIFMQKTGRYFL